MTDEISTVACQIGCVKIHQSRNMNCWKINRLAMYELLDGEMKFEYYYEFYCLVNRSWLIIVVHG